jgi:hypothetical protein
MGFQALVEREDAMSYALEVAAWYLDNQLIVLRDRHYARPTFSVAAVHGILTDVAQVHHEEMVVEVRGVGSVRKKMLKHLKGGGFFGELSAIDPQLVGKG